MTLKQKKIFKSVKQRPGPLKIKLINLPKNDKKLKRKDTNY